MALGIGDVRYIVARGFTSHEGVHVPGELLPKDADGWFNMQHLIGMNWVYPYVPEEGYGHLPPHVFSAVVTLQEARGLIAKGEAPLTSNWEKPPEVLAAEQEKEVEQLSHQKNAERMDVAASKLFTRDDTEAVEFHVPPSNEDAKKLEAQHIGLDDDSDVYADKTKAELEEEIAKRNKEKDRSDDNKLRTSGTKAELSQALLEDDRSK